MSDGAKPLDFVAELVVGTNTEKVAISALSMTDCTIRLPRSLAPRQFVILRLYENQEDGKPIPFKAIKATVERAQKSKADSRICNAKIRFNDTIRKDHGVTQILFPEKFAQTGKSQSFKTENSCLRGVSVRCHMCGQGDVPFLLLQKRKMLTKENIFGVPSYVKSLPGQDFCDYNLLRMSVCPKCYFSSSDILHFQKPTEKESFPAPPFDKGIILDEWTKSIPQRKKRIESLLDGFFDEKRSFEQALIAYDLGVMTSDEVFKVDKRKDIKYRNYDPKRQAVSYLMFKAELLMSHDQPQAADKTLEEASARLEEIFPFLNDEPCIKAGFLMGMFGLYFDDKKQIRRALSFLRGYNQDGKVKKGSDEYKTLHIKVNKLNEAYEDQADYNKDNLKSFHRT